MALNTRNKGISRRESRDKRPQAHVKNVRISSRKVGQVIDLIRGKSAVNALAILKFTPKSASPVVYKLLMSAIANAENNLSLNRDNLYVAEVYANQGPVYKRYVAKAEEAHRRCCAVQATSA